MNLRFDFAGQSKTASSLSSRKTDICAFSLATENTYTSSRILLPRPGRGTKPDFQRIECDLAARNGPSGKCPLFSSADANKK